MKLQSVPSTVSLAIAVLVFAGCSALKPKPDPSQFYVLRSQASAPAVNQDSSASVGKIRVGPWRLAGYLKSTPILVDGGTNTLERLHYSRWAEPMEKGISRVLAENLNQLLNTSGIVIYPDETSTDTGFEVSYTVFKCEGTLDGEVVFEVDWEVRDRDSGKTLGEEHSRYVIPPDASHQDVGNYVARISAALEKWSHDVARVISASK